MIGFRSTWVLLLVASCVLEWRGARCEEDVDECAEALVSCGPGRCVNLPGGYTCECSEGYCGDECALADPCFTAIEQSDETGDTHGPCQHGAACTQRCGARQDYECACLDGWAGKNCSQQAVAAEASGGMSATRVALAVGGALLALLVAAGALAALAAQARRKRATRGTYSPSGQEYCNPRAEMITHALKPPPEERLI